MDNEFERVTGAATIYQRVTEDQLYLQTGGQMVDVILEMADEYGPLVAFFKGSAGVAVIFPGIPPERKKDVMLFVAEPYRGSGLAERLVKQVLLETEYGGFVFFPWDPGSGLFFSKMVRKGILNHHHFLPEGLRRMELADRLRRKYTV